jgi:hypothetical protein
VKSIPREPQRKKDEQVFGSSHDSELDGTLVAELLVAPLSDRSDLLDGCDTVVGDEDLWEPGVIGAQRQLWFSESFEREGQRRKAGRKEGKRRALLITLCPPCDLTKSATLDGGAVSRSLPPMARRERREDRESVCPFICLSSSLLLLSIRCPSI